MLDKIELLSTKLLNDKNKLKEIDHWLSVFNLANGWHYDLDLIWILKHIEELNIPKGATILDAGGGMGILQFILAARGYNIISLDFTKRNFPKFAKGIFNLEINNRDLGNYTHQYMEWMTYGEGSAYSLKHNLNSFAQKLRKNIFKPRIIARRIFYELTNIKNKMNVTYLFEKYFFNHDNFGKIVFLRGTFNDIPLENESVDLLVSLSAFEHNTYEDMPGSINEFARILKKNSLMLVTTSACEVYDKDWYFETARAWNFRLQTLQKWFNASINNSLNFQESLKAINSSPVIKSRINSFYKNNAQNGLPYGKLENNKYVPVGILKWKQIQ